MRFTSPASAPEALDQSGKRVLITGANSGIGFETAAALAARGAEVVLACRRDEVLTALGERSASDAVAAIRLRHPRALVHRLDLDLASQQSVKDASQDFVRRFGRLDILINNAGVMWLPQSRTEDGFETQLAVNHLGHYTLTCLLLPALLQGSGSRVVTVSSLTHRSAELDLTDLFYERRKYVTTKVYAQTKLANLLFARELGRRLASSGSSMLSVAAHPGLANTNLFVSAFPNAKRFGAVFAGMASVYAQSAARASLPTLYAATMPNMRNGDYVGPSGWLELWGAPGPARSTRAAQDAASAEALWRFSEEATNVRADLSPRCTDPLSAPTRTLQGEGIEP